MRAPPFGRAYPLQKYKLARYEPSPYPFFLRFYWPRPAKSKFQIEEWPQIPHFYALPSRKKRMATTRIAIHFFFCPLSRQPLKRKRSTGGLMFRLCLRCRSGSLSVLCIVISIQSIGGLKQLIIEDKDTNAKQQGTENAPAPVCAATNMDGRLPSGKFVTDTAAELRPPY